MKEFTSIPILGRKVNVPANDPSMFQVISDGIALTHDAGGVNFDLVRKRNACTKSFGYTQWDSAATAEHTKCLGLFELYDGSNRNHFYFDNGRVYYYNSALEATALTPSPDVQFSNNNNDLYSIIKVGSYMAFADHGGHTPYKWKHGDANLTKLSASGTEYVFRYLMSFQRRVIGLYTTETNGDIIVRWSTDWPTTAIADLNFPDANQLYIPNDDSIIGGHPMGSDRAYVYCEDSINQIVYYPDYDVPFRMFTVVPKQSFANHHSIVNLGDRHIGFNRNYGFCEYRGGDVFPYGGRPISEDIESDLQEIHSDYYNVIVGTFVPFTREVAWLVPMGGQGVPTHIMFYGIDTGQWRIENKIMRYLDSWRMYNSYTWNNLITDLGGAGATWADAGTNTWAYYLAMRQRLVYGGTDGHLRYQTGEELDGYDFNAWRDEPVMDFGDPKRKDLLKEIWLDIGAAGTDNITIYHRMGDTVGQLQNRTFTLLGNISTNNPATPALRNFAKSARFHQIRLYHIGSEKFEINKIIYKYEPQSEN